MKDKEYFDGKCPYDDTPVNCVEMKATIDLYHIYAEKFNNSTIKNERYWYADICAVLLNRIREMEKRLHGEVEE